MITVGKAMKNERLSDDEGRRHARAMVLKAKKQRRRTKLLITVTTCVALLAFVAVTILAAIYVPQVAIYVPVIALALALALQKYTASFFAFFVITFSKIYDLGDRIRIGETKGDVRHIGLLHTTLEEVGEDEKLGGELTGRLLYVPNLIILDQPVLNYSKDYSTGLEAISSDYMFDEVRIPLTIDSNVEKASQLLESILKSQDEVYVKQAGQVFQDGYPRFLDEAMSGPRVLIFVEPQHIWIKGKFVAPLESRNDLRSSILLQFIKEAAASSDIKLA
ncbi:MAG: mechanosensitive ion channel family protein [Dehalococcoidia bacterium]|nr:mechanosensitive ion channel family protein [Dehalococcoidia bacterium]